jgi:hypothetical protein
MQASTAAMSVLVRIVSLSFFEESALKASLISQSKLRN